MPTRDELKNTEQGDTYTKPITNRQWFKNLIQEATDEDLAKYYASFCNFCIYKDIPKYCKIHDCHTGHLEWLKAEHKE